MVWCILRWCNLRLDYVALSSGIWISSPYHIRLRSQLISHLVITKICISAWKQIYFVSIWFLIRKTLDGLVHPVVMHFAFRNCNIIICCAIISIKIGIIGFRILLWCNLRSDYVTLSSGIWISSPYHIRLRSQLISHLFITKICMSAWKQIFFLCSNLN
jgi:hypothetical protein